MKHLVFIFLLTVSIYASAYDGNGDLVNHLRNAEIDLSNFKLKITYKEYVKCGNYDNNGNCIATGVAYIVEPTLFPFSYSVNEEFNDYTDTVGLVVGKCTGKLDFSLDRYEETIQTIADLPSGTKLRYDYDYSNGKIIHPIHKELKFQVRDQFKVLKIDPQSVVVSVEPLSYCWYGPDIGGGGCYAVNDPKGVKFSAYLTPGIILNVSCTSGMTGGNEKTPNITAGYLNSVFKNDLIITK